MVLRLLHRNAFNTSYIIRSYLLDNVDYKRSFVKKTQNLFLFETRKGSSYEGDGKTVGFVLNKKSSKTLTISEIMKEGFTLSNGTEIVGSVILFPHTIISWHILRAADVTEESLVLLKLLDPKIDILVFGYGTRNDFTPEVQKNFAQICKKLGIRYEALPTDKAVGVFNFLSEEQRLVAAALLPPSYIDPLKFERTNNYYLESDMKEEEEQERTLKELKLLQDATENKKLLK